MISKEQQDLAWKCLPKEVRDQIKEFYQSEYCNRVADELFDTVFGYHNLTSETEPKFKVGDKVKIVGAYTEATKSRLGKVGKINNIANTNDYLVLFENGQDWIHVSCLEPYTEEPNVAILDATEETKDNMEEKDFNLCKILQECEGEQIFLTDEGECKIVSVTEDVLTLTRNGNDIIELRDDSLFLNPTGCAYAFPSMESFIANPLNARKAWMEWSEARKPKRWRAKSSSGVPVSECEGYWEDYSYWYITSDGVIAQDEEMNCNADNLRYELGNYFRTEEEALQAAEAVRELLEKFHENQTEQ